jgi:hypothetical protein
VASKFHMLHMFCGWNPWVIPQFGIDNVYENVDDVVDDDDDADDDDNNADADADDDVLFIHDITSGDQTW